MANQTPNSSLGQQPFGRTRADQNPVNVGKKVIGSQSLFRGLAYGFALLRGILIVAVILILFNVFVATVFSIDGQSMYPSFEDGQFILVDRLSYQFTEPQRGDVIVLRFPGDPTSRNFIKRVVGLPGEKVEINNNTVLINDVPIQENYLPAFTPTAPNLTVELRADEVFAMGDNRPNSNDSRAIGPVPIRNIIGVSRAVISGSAFGFIAQPAF